MARRRWIADEWGSGRAALVGTQARHLARVLRAAPGMRYEVLAGSEVWLARVSSVAEDRVEFQLESEVPAERALALTLVLAVFKFDRFEWAVEKATELGVERIVPVLARRTEKHLAQAAAARGERWRRLAHEAAKQSRRADLPVLEDARSLGEAVPLILAATRLQCAENERTVQLFDALRSARDGDSVALAVGPEGGWTEEEDALFLGNGWQAVSLGPRILRAETAAIAATAIAAASLG